MLLLVYFGKIFLHNFLSILNILCLNIHMLAAGYADSTISRLQGNKYYLEKNEQLYYIWDQPAKLYFMEQFSTHWENRDSLLERKYNKIYQKFTVKWHKRQRSTTNLNCGLWLTPAAFVTCSTARFHKSCNTQDVC